MFTNIRRAILAIVLLTTAGCCYAQESPEDFLELGNKSMAAGDVNEAILHYKDGLIAVDDVSESPAEMMDLEIALGNAYAKEGEVEGAKDHFENAIKVANGAKRRFRESLGYQKAEALYKFADIIRFDDLQTAVAYFTEAGSLRKGYWQAWIKLGRITEDVFDLKRETIEGFKNSIKTLRETETELLKLNPEPDQDLKDMIKEQEKEIKQMIKDSFIFNERSLKAFIRGYGILKTMDKKDIINYPEDDFEKTMSKIQLAIGRGAVKTGNKNCSEVIGGSEEKVFCKAVAIQAYENALEHDPSNEEAKKFLDILYKDESKRVDGKDYVKDMLKAFADRRLESYEADRDEL